MKYAPWLVVLVLVGALGVTQCQLRSQERETVEALNLAASKDEGLRTLTREKDSTVAVFQRLAMQTKVELRAILRERGRRGTVVATVAVAGDTAILDTAGAVPVPDSALTVQGAIDRRDSLGVAVTASVVIPPDRASSLWSWRIERSPLPLEISLSCRGRIAESAIVGPVWANATMRVVQDPRICSPPSWKPFALSVPSVPTAVLLVTIGVGVGRLVK